MYINKSSRYSKFLVVFSSNEDIFDSHLWILSRPSLETIAVGSLNYLYGMVIGEYRCYQMS